MWPPVLALLAAWLVPVCSVGATPVIIDPEVRRQLAHGPARVLVELRLAAGARPEADASSSSSVNVQRTAIAAAQSRVLSRLTGTHFSLLKHYESLPMLLLEIQDDALSSLAQMSDDVARVVPDTRKAPSQPAR